MSACTSVLVFSYILSVKRSKLQVLVQNIAGQYCAKYCRSIFSGDA